MNRRQKMIIYQVLPRLFGNQNDACKCNGTIEENGVGKLADFTPKVLREIKMLGCTHIWYTGIIEHATQTDYTRYGIERDNMFVVKGKAGSPYAIKDYYDVDPDLAVNISERMQEFESLVGRSHAAGLKVIIDFVPNHVARRYHSDAKPDGVIDLGQNDNSEVHFDPQNNFYYIPRQEFQPQFYIGEGDQKYREYPAKATGNDCFGAYPNRNDWYETVKLNYGVDYLHGRRKCFDPIPDTWFKMRDILLFWCSKGIDGFRCDMAEMVPVEFWGWVIPRIKELYSGVDFIAEIYNPHEYRYYIEGGKFDYLYDKVGLYDLLRSIVNGHAAASQITRCWQSLDGITTHMLNFLENHDEQRIASPNFAGDPFRAYPALIVSAMMNVNPMMIYFGQELGEPAADAEGFSGLDGRTTIFDYWSVPSVRAWYAGGTCSVVGLTPEQKELRRRYKQVLTLCNKEAAIREGAFFDLMYVNGDNPNFDARKQYAFLRKKDNELLVIIVNFCDRAVDVGVKLPQHAFDLWNMAAREYSAKELLTGDVDQKVVSPEILFRSSVKAYGAVIWKCTDTNNRKKKI